MSVGLAPGGAVRRLAFAFAVALAATLAALAARASDHAGAATLGAVTVSPANPSATWQGSDSFDGLPPCLTADSCDTVPIHLEGLTQDYLNSHYVVLQVTIRWDESADGYELELDNKGGNYIRSSAADTGALPHNPLLQRVAVHLTDAVDFTHDMSALVTPDQADGGYRGRVRLIDEGESDLFPAAGFDRTNLSLRSEGPTIGAGEPSIAIGPTGTIHVTAPASTPAGAGTDPFNDDEPEKGVLYFRNAHGDGHWTSQNIGSAFGGGDSDIVADDDAGTYVQDLALAPSTIFQFKSENDGQDFEQQPPYTIDADRQWLATYMRNPDAPTSKAFVYTVYHGLANQEVIFCISRNGGLTTTCKPGITSPQIQLNATGNTDQGNVVVERDGDADFVFATSTLPENIDPNAPAPGVGALHNLYIGHFNRQTGNITNHPIYLGPEGHWVTGLFPVLAIDKRDNLYVSWPESPSDAASQASGPWVLKLSHSTDGGKTWSAPDVMNPPSLKNNLLNWITVGDPGNVDVIWAGTTRDTNQYDARARWFMFNAQTRDGLAAHPDFDYTQITPHPIRYGNVCVLGLFCPSDDSRSLLDFAQVEVDRACRANVVYGDISTYIPALHRRNQIFRGDGTSTLYARQGADGFPLCEPGTGGAGGAGSFDFPH